MPIERNTVEVTIEGTTEKQILDANKRVHIATVLNVRPFLKAAIRNSVRNEYLKIARGLLGDIDDVIRMYQLYQQIAEGWQTKPAILRSSGNYSLYSLQKVAELSKTNIIVVAS